MISLAIPGISDFHWSHLVLDVNGTLTIDGSLLTGVPERLRALSSQVAVHLLTADTRGTACELARDLGVDWKRVHPGREAEQKRAHVQALGAERVIAIGNGNNDAMMLSAASLGIVVVGQEGAAIRALLSADVVVRDVVDGLDLLLDPIRLLSTLRC